MRIYYGKRKLNKQAYEIYHEDRLDIYDKNDDDIISLEEYLAKEESQGYNAIPGDIDYNYQDYSNVFNYFYILFVKIKDFKIMCIPNMTVKHFGVEDRVAVAYYKKEQKLVMASNIQKSICYCKKKKDVRFLFFSFILINNKKESFSHANIIVIDLFKKTLERFEPHGYYNTTTMNNIIKNKLMKKIGIDDYKYLEPQKLSPYQGIQKKADAFCGMCVTITMMYLHMRILNPDIKQNKIVSYFLDQSKNELKTTILRYARFVELKLKRFKNITFKLQDKILERIKC